MPVWSVEKKEFIRICQRTLAMGMQVSTGGNVSMRLEENLFLVKPSGISLYDLEEQALVTTDIRGAVLEGTRKPTKEINTHLSIYEIRKDIGAIVHYHSPYATAYAVRSLELPLVTVHAKRILKRVPLVPLSGEGSEELATAAGTSFADPDVQAALLSGHGMMAAGSDIRQAQNIAELVEETAKVAYLSGSLSTEGISSLSPQR